MPVDAKADALTVKDRVLTIHREMIARYRIEIIIVVVAALADMVSTIWFMTRFGAEYELHPVIRLVSQWFGTVAGPVVGKVGQLAALWVVVLLLRRWARPLIWVVAAIYAWAAWHNVTHMFELNQLIELAG